MARLKGYIILGFLAGVSGKVIPGLGGTFLVSLVLAFLFKLCFNLYRSQRALQLDRKAIQARQPPGALLAWHGERAKNPIDQKYQLGWFSAIAILGILLAVLPPIIAGPILVYGFIAEILAVAFFSFRVRAARLQFLQAAQLRS